MREWFGDARRYVGWERYGVGIVGLACIVVLVCIITLTPTPVDKDHSALVAEVLKYLHAKGVPAWFGYNKLEFSANIVMFVPLGFFVGLLIPLRWAWIGGLAGTTFSVFVEVVQFFVLPARFATVVDVLANTVGGWIGIGLAVLIRLAVSARDRRRESTGTGRSAASSPIAVEIPGEPISVFAPEAPRAHEADVAAAPAPGVQPGHTA